MVRKDRASNRPRRAGKAPKNNSPRSNKGMNRPNSGANTGNTGSGTTHKGSSGKGSAKMILISGGIFGGAFLLFASAVGGLIYLHITA